jgi:hypothetical protein
MNNYILYSICGVVLVFGLVMFARAYHYGQESLGRIGKSETDQKDDQSLAQ